MGKFTKQMQKKLVVLFLCILLAFVGLSVRLVLINRDNGEQYKKKVLSQQQYNSTILPFKRGDIIDAKGTKMAISEKVYNVILDANMLLNAGEEGECLEPTISALVQCFGLDSGEIRSFITGNPSSRYKVLAKKKKYEETSKFTEMQEKEDSNIAGVWFEDAYIRNYPYGTLACDVLGFTQGLNEGYYGLEEYYNDTLNGTNGREYGYLNDDANLERTIKPAVDGNTLISTIDMNIQSIVEKHILAFNEKHRNNFRQEPGSEDTGVIIMNPNTGEILAMATYPVFDLNNPRDEEILADYVDPTELSAMTEEDRLEKLNSIWKNFCIADSYEPGSTAKPFTIAEGLDTGKLSGSESYECLGALEVGGHRIRCNNRYGHGWVDVEGALDTSCNVALMKMGATIGTPTFYNYQSIFNFGLRTGIDLAGEARTAGLIFPENMTPTDLAIGSFGQGYNVTMIEMITGFSSLINGGYYYEPHVVNRIVNAQGATVETIEPRVLKQTISAQTSDKIRQYCTSAVMGELGTGKKARPAGYAIGGKTGTAQKIPRADKQYLVSFIGFAPADNPQIAIYTVVNRPNFEAEAQATASFALEITRNILTEVLPYMGIFMTEELSEEEIKELEEKKITFSYGSNTISGNSLSGNGVGGNSVSGNNVSGNEVGEEGLVSGNSVSSNLPEPRYDEETGYLIEPETGALLDPETGEPVEGGLPVLDF